MPILDERGDRFVLAQPRFQLTTLPSPLERASRLEEALREQGAPGVPRIYLKRDDLLSLGMGGNKIRNLEFSIGAALAAGATDVVTAGRLQSNHCRLTAAACARAGLRAHLVFAGDEPTAYTGNLLLDRVFGARLYFAGAGDAGDRDRDRRAALVERVRADIEREGGVPYVIPVGGSDEIGALGHVLAVPEILAQCAALGEHLDEILVATATGGTQAGLMAGLRQMEHNARVGGFNVATKPTSELAPFVDFLAGYMCQEMNGPWSTDDAWVIEAAGQGYGIPSPGGTAAVELLARTEGVLADPVYTGKALAAFFEMIRSDDYGDDDTVVFIHTGGTPALFA